MVWEKHGVDLLECDSFQQLMAKKGIRPRAYRTHIEAMEAADLLETICQLGDRILVLTRHEQITAKRAEVLILDLITCFAEPIEWAQRSTEIGRELREYKR